MSFREANATPTGVGRGHPDDPLGMIQEGLGDQRFRSSLGIDPDGRPVGIVGWSDRVPHLPEFDFTRIVADATQRTADRGHEEEEVD